MNVHGRQMSLRGGPVKVSPFVSSETSALQTVNSIQVSPPLAFDSGPGFESKPLELDLRNLPSADTPELDSCLRDLLMESMRTGSMANEDDDAVSEISTCSSVVALETVDEGELGNSPSLSRRQNTRASSFTAGTKTKSSEGSSYNSSSEAEEEDGRKAARKISAKISDLFSFNAPSFSGNGVSEESDEPNCKPPPGERRRKLSITRRISPLSLHGIFAGNQSTSTNKQESTSEKSETNKKTRKLSLTMFNRPSSHSTEKAERKRRNTDPQLPPNQQVTTTIENEKKKNKEDIASERKESQTKPVPEQALFKEEDVKIHDLIKHVLRAHLLSMTEYKRETCDRVCKSICRILKTLVASMKESENVPQCKVVCQAYIGSVREEGLFATVQTLWENEKDNFAAASFRNDSLFGFASVITTTLY